jgi:hypothetical protein
MGVTSGTGTAYPSRTVHSSFFSWVDVAQSYLCFLCCSLSF